jgi:hypothetical protein
LSAESSGALALDFGREANSGTVWLCLRSLRFARLVCSSNASRTEAKAVSKDAWLAALQLLLIKYLIEEERIA